MQQPTLAYRRAVEVVARTEQLPMSAIRKPVGRRQKRARWLALYLAGVAAGCGIKPSARAARVHPRIAQQAVRWWEDRRDDPAIDEQLGHLEEQLHAAFI